MYSINEGSLKLPFNYTDGSITLLTFPVEKSSLTIVRGEMPAGLSLMETVELQKNLFLREFKTVVIGDTQHARLGTDPGLEAAEFFCMFDKSAVKQYQMNLLFKQQAFFMTFSYTQLRDFTREDLAHWQQIKTHFTPADDWHQRMTGLTHG